MENLLTSDFLTVHNIKQKKGVNINCKKICTDFDLQDIDDFIVPFGTGIISFSNKSGAEIKVLSYEKFFTSLKHFSQGKMCCDFLLYDGNNSFFILTEITSGKHLDKPIHKNNEIVFAGGKREKAEKQLYETLKLLCGVESISNFIEKYANKVCCFGYKLVNVFDGIDIKAPIAFNKYREIESQEVGENGAIISSSHIEALGFEYRRISHDYVFELD